MSLKYKANSELKKSPKKTEKGACVIQGICYIHCVERECVGQADVKNGPADTLGCKMGLPNGGCHVTLDHNSAERLCV